MSDGNTVRIREVQLINYDLIKSDKPEEFHGQLDEAISGHHRRGVILVR